MTEQSLPRESEPILGTEPAPSDTAVTPEPAPEPATAPPPARPAPQKSTKQLKAEKKAGDPLRGSRASGLYASVAALGVVLVLLIIFIAQNTQTTRVNFLTFSGKVSVAVALLIAAAAGLFLAVVASSLRILQLRRRVKRDRRAA